MNPVSHPSSTLLVPLFAYASALMRDNALLLGGWGIPAVLVSLVGLAFVLPRQWRSRLRVPAIFFVVYISLDFTLLAVRAFFPEPDWERRRLFLHNVVLFFFLAALAQTLFLLFEVLVLGSPERVDGGALDRIWYAFARNGIEIPVATHAVRMTELPAPPTLESPNGREERRLRLLERVDVFRVLPEPSLRQLAQQGREVIFGRGEVVLRQGDPGQSLFVIDLGEVVISVARDNAPPVEVNRLGPSAFFGEMSLLTGEPRSATVTTAVQSRMLMIDKPAFEAVMRQSPHLAEAISRVLVERQTGLTRSIQDSTHNEVAKSDFFRRIDRK